MSPSARKDEVSPLPEREVRRRFRFAGGLRFDLLYSLEVLLNPSARIHSEWKREALAALPNGCREDLAYFGNSPRFWIFVADALGPADPTDDARAILDGFAALEPNALRNTILEGVLHDADAVRRIVRGERTLRQALLEAPPEKREWLEHIDLYPPGLNTPTFEALSKIAEDPLEAKVRIVRVLDAYWRSVFERAWRKLEPQLQRSLSEKARLFESCTLDEFFRATLLRLEANAEKGHLRAIRGGYVLPYAHIREAFVLPSAFNHHRFWTAFDAEGGTVVFLPYFDAAVALDGAHRTEAEPAAEIDPALILKALGDATRFAMATLIARTPMTSADLAAALGLSRPTISHHVVLLREAGLLREESSGGSFLLHLRREPLQALSDAVLRRLSGSPSDSTPPAPPLSARSRGRRRK